MGQHNLTSTSLREQEHVERTLVNLCNEVNNPREQILREHTGNGNHNVIDISQMLAYNDIKLLRKV